MLTFDDDGRRLLMPSDSVYLAGPMRGIPEYNFPAFKAATESLRADNWKVWSPAENDVELDNFDPVKDEPRDMAHYMARDLPAVCAADAVVVLPGWESSEGCAIEVYVARAVGKPIFTYPNLHELREEPAEKRAPGGEVRSVDPQTGGEKGTKLARFDLIPAGPLFQLAEHYGRGVEQGNYAPRNWELGYSWGKSFAAMMRHAWAFWRGEDIDEQTGSPHLAAVAWHAFALLEWGETHPEKDDRQSTLVRMEGTTDGTESTDDDHRG
ncbi:MAG: DUF4406 domain-containing protein [bacterium]|nr:DUF4406 domain-containing protein [bacterium]